MMIMMIMKITTTQCLAYMKDPEQVIRVLQFPAQPSLIDKEGEEDKDPETELTIEVDNNVTPPLKQDEIYEFTIGFNPATCNQTETIMDVLKKAVIVITKGQKEQQYYIPQPTSTLAQHQLITLIRTFHPQLPNALTSSSI